MNASRKACARDRSGKRPDREGKRLLAAHVDPEVFDEFQLLVATKGSTVDYEIHTAIALLFERHKQPFPPALELKLLAALERQRRYRRDPVQFIESLLLRRANNANPDQHGFAERVA